MCIVRSFVFEQGNGANDDGNKNVKTKADDGCDDKWIELTISL